MLWVLTRPGIKGWQRDKIRCLGPYPLERGIERFGDDTPATMRIRVWMRTAVRQHVTAFGTFFSTLGHECCHHLDAQRFAWHDSPHTRGFYARTATLSHHARGTPLKPLCWIQLPGERWRIDWRQTHHGC